MQPSGTLEDWRDGIAIEVPFVGRRPFSHNIINISLNAIADRFGKEEANRAIREFGLVELGWNEVL